MVLEKFSDVQKGKRKNFESRASEHTKGKNLFLVNHIGWFTIVPAFKDKLKHKFFISIVLVRVSL